MDMTNIWTNMIEIHVSISLQNISIIMIIILYQRHTHSPWTNAWRPWLIIVFEHKRAV